MNFFDPFLPKSGAGPEPAPIENLPVNPRVKKSPKKKSKARREKAAEQARDTDGKFSTGPNFITRLFMVLQGKHKTVIRRSKATTRRMNRQHANRMYENGSPAIPQKKKARKARRIKRNGIKR